MGLGCRGSSGRLAPQASVMNVQAHAGEPHTCACPSPPVCVGAVFGETQSHGTAVMEQFPPIISGREHLTGGTLRSLGSSFGAGGGGGELGESGRSMMARTGRSSGRGQRERDVNGSRIGLYTGNPDRIARQLGEPAARARTGPGLGRSQSLPAGRMPQSAGGSLRARGELMRGLDGGAGLLVQPSAPQLADTQPPAAPQPPPLAADAPPPQPPREAKAAPPVPKLDLASSKSLASLMMKNKVKVVKARKVPR